MTSPTPPRPRPRRSRAVPISHLRTECTTAEFALLGFDRSLKEQIERWKPGGTENQGRDAYCWLRFYRTLHRELAVRQQHPNAGPAGAPAEDAIITASLSNEPKRVLRLLPDAEGNPVDLLVHPKSWHALVHLMSRDQCLGFLAREITRIGVVGSAEQLDAHVRALDEIDLQQRLCAWILTTPGPGLPFLATDRAPEPPEWTKTLETTEIVDLIAAHQDVNRERLAYLRALIEEDPEAKGSMRPSWSVFFGALGTELQVRPEALMRDRSLCELLAQVRLSAASKREAIERARDEAERKRPAA